MKKSMKSRLTNGLFAAVVMAILFTFCAIPASADTAVPAAEPTVASEFVPAIADLTELSLTAMPAAPAAIGFPVPGISVLAAGGGGAASGSAEADAAYTNVINFFITWIRRVGWMVAFVGGIMFALSIKNHDAEQKTAGLLTMVAGFVVAALCIAADMFHLFT